MIALIAIIVLIFVFIVLILAGAHFLGFALALAGLVVSALKYSNAKKLEPSSKKCPKCGSENVVISAGDKRSNCSVAVCQNCADRFEYWTSHDIKKEIDSQKTNIIIGLIVVLVFFFTVGSSGRKSNSSRQASSTTPSNTQEPSTNQTTTNDVPQKQEEKTEYTVTNRYFDIYTNTLNDKRFYGIIEVENTGSTNLYLHAKSFDVEDDSGHLVATEKTISTCPDIIVPGEKGYLYTSLSGSLPDETDMSAHYSMTYSLDIRKATKTPVIYEVTDLSYGTGSFGSPSITGRVTNNSGSDDSLVYVQAVFYDASGNPIAASGTNISDLSNGTTQSFEITLFGLGSYIDASKIASYKVYARKMHIQFN